MARSASPGHRCATRSPTPLLSDHVNQVIAGVREESLTYLSPENLGALASVTAEADRASRPGLVVEAGTALGGVGDRHGRGEAAGERPMKVYDVFGIIPPPSDRAGRCLNGMRYESDRGRRRQGASAGRSTTATATTCSARRRGAGLSAPSCMHLVHRHGASTSSRGLFEDTILLDEPVAVAHLDGGYWYALTMTCLERIAPLLPSRAGGSSSTTTTRGRVAGPRVDEYFAGRPGFRLEHRAKVHVVRT